MRWKRYIRLWDYAWWIWLVMAGLLLLGLLGSPVWFLAALMVGLWQAIAFAMWQNSLRAFSVQLRIAYLLILLLCFPPPLRLLYWLPALGTLVLVSFGYCILSRLLSLLPWNRTEPLSLVGLWATFATPPRVEAMVGGVSATACPGGVCTLEVQLGKRTPGPAGPAWRA